MKKLLQGVWLSEGHVKARNVKRLRRQGNSTWLRIVLSEGKNREIRRVCEHLGWPVNRLIRLSFGPFQLGHLLPGAVEEVTGKVLREQLGAMAPAKTARGKPGARGRDADRRRPA